MNALEQYAKEHNLDEQGLADLLSEKLNRKISAKGVEMQFGRKEPSKPWLNALGITPKEPKNQENSPTGVNPTPISPPIQPLPFEPVSARATLELIYTMAGKGAAMASKTPAVANLWEAQAPSLAEGWINWAQENRTVANVITMLTVGGPGGQVILMNASLLVATLMAIQQQKGIQFVPPGFVPPHEDPNMDEDKVRQNTEAGVDHQLRFPQ